MYKENKGLHKIIVCAGTAGELIKLYPLLIRLDEAQAKWCFLFTGQSPVNFWNQWDDFNLPRVKVETLLQTEHDLKTTGQALFWFIRAALAPIKNVRQKVFDKLGGVDVRNTTVIVHGDTLSTLIGAFFAKRFGAHKIAHVEAGLRSSMLLKPFPEEITRRLVSRIANVHFPQDGVAYLNLCRSRVGGVILPTKINTLYDALFDVEQRFPDFQAPSGTYVVANLHRFENLNSIVRWNTMIDTLCQAAKNYKVYFVQHPPAAQKLDSDLEARERLINAGVILLPRQPFTGFMRMIHGAHFIISDGGSNQEECAYLGKPCLILRDATERVEGLNGGSCLLTKFDKKLISDFLELPDLYRRDPISVEESPSSIIVNYCLSN